MSRLKKPLTPGTVLLDMHDGWRSDYLDEKFGIWFEEKFRTGIETTLGTQIIQMVVSEATGKPYSYTNKHLVVISADYVGMGVVRVLAAYSFDARFLSFLTIEGYDEVK